VLRGAEPDGAASAQRRTAIAGYAHPSYARSFSEFGTPLELPHCGGWALERTIAGSRLRDAMGCYPIFCCRDWTRLHLDLSPLAERLVSLTLVTDPFGNFNEGGLRSCFDVVMMYKQHYVTDLNHSVKDFLRGHHRRNTARARDDVRLETCADPMRHVDEWLKLYAHLIERHRITGIRAFSPLAFAQQLAVPGLAMFRATAKGDVVGLHLWYIQGDVAYTHLGATSALGYKLMAPYALYWYAIDQLRHRVRWLDLGAAAGVSNDDSVNGLDDFKRGWSTGTRPVFLCGRIFQPGRYAQLANDRGTEGAPYFPAYRRGEFG